MNQTNGEILHLTIDGRSMSAPTDPAGTLAEALREDFDVVAVRIGCANGDCGTCTAIVDGRYTKTCLVLPHRAEGADVRTIAGLGSASAPSVVQEAFVTEYAFQCGYCLPGMLLSSCALLERDPDPTEDHIRDALSGNICRCTGYHNAVRAVHRAADMIRQDPEQIITTPDRHTDTRRTI